MRVRTLIPIHPGVYALGHRPRTRESRWMAVVLLGGLGAALFRLSAGALWGVHARSHCPEVTVPRQRRPRPGVVFHHCVLPADELTVRDGIPVTTVPRTLFDLATVLRPGQLERCLIEAEPASP